MRDGHDLNPLNLCSVACSAANAIEIGRLNRFRHPEEVRTSLSEQAVTAAGWGRPTSSRPLVSNSRPHPASRKQPSNRAGRVKKSCGDVVAARRHLRDISAHRTETGSHFVDKMCWLFEGRESSPRPERQARARIANAKSFRSSGPVPMSRERAKNALVVGSVATSTRSRDGRA